MSKRNGTYLSGAELLRKIQLKREDVEIEIAPGERVHVLVWEIDGNEVEKLHEALSGWHREIKNAGTQEQHVDIRFEPTAHRALVRLSWLALKTENGERLFEFEELVGRLPITALETIFAVAARLSPNLFQVPKPATAADREAGEIAAGKDSSETASDTEI